MVATSPLRSGQEINRMAEFFMAAQRVYQRLGRRLLGSNYGPLAPKPESSGIGREGPLNMMVCEPLESLPVQRVITGLLGFVMALSCLDCMGQDVMGQQVHILVRP